MFYHVVRRPPHNYENSTNEKKISSKTDKPVKLMPRYHYSRVAPSTTNTSDSYFSRQHLAGHSARPIMTATTSNNNNPNNRNNIFSYGPFKSTFVPLTTNTRPSTSLSTKRETVQIPIIKEDGTNVNDTSMRPVPVTFINTTTPSPINMATNVTTNSKPQFTSFLRPNSRYSQNYLHKTGEEQTGSLLPTFPRLSTAPRRLSLTIPVVTTVNDTTPRESPDGEDINESIQLSSSPNYRSNTLRFSHGVSSTPFLSVSNSRTSSALHRPTTKPDLINSSLPRQKTLLNDSSTQSELFSPAVGRRAEVMAREAIQGVVRFQEQQHGDNSTLENSNNLLSVRSPATSRRFVINLRNNQSISLDSRLSSVNSSSDKPPIASPSGRTPLRHNINHPILPQENIFPPTLHPVTVTNENSSSSSTINGINSMTRGSFKNEFRMEIPVNLITTTNDQDSSLQLTDEKQDVLDEEQQSINMSEKFLSANQNSNPTLKSILKRSSSREAVSRKNVSFMNV